MSPAERFLEAGAILGPAEKRAILSKDVLGQIPWRDILASRRALIAGLGKGDGIDDLQRLDMAAYLPDDVLTKVDRATMMCSLESRAPLLDDRVVELGLALPECSRIDGRRGKVVLRELAARYVPRNTIERPKQGFSAPIGNWLRGPLASALRDAVAVLERSGLFRAEALVRYRVLSPRADAAAERRSWLLFCLGLWLETRVR